MGTHNPRGAVAAPAWRRRGINLLTLLIAVAGTLLAVELGLRAADRLGWISTWADLRQARTASIWMASDNSDLIYRHRPNYFKDGTRYTESHGILRRTDANETPNPATTRIVLLGDSVAASIYLPYEQRFSTLLQESLSSREGASGAFEVLNFAVNGYSTSQEATLLEMSAGDFEPDLLMLQFCMNDFHPTMFPTRWFEPHPGSYVLTLARYFFDRRLLDGYPEALYWEKNFRTDKAGWESVADGFDRISAHARARDIPVFFVIFPLLSLNGWYEGDAVGRHEQVRELARTRGFETLDLLPVLAEYPVDSLQESPWDTFHLNAEGHRIAAGAIETALWELDPKWRMQRQIGDGDTDGPFAGYIGGGCKAGAGGESDCGAPALR